MSAIFRANCVATGRNRTTMTADCALPAQTMTQNYFDDGSLVIRPAQKRYALSQLVEQAKSMTPPPAIDDAPMGDEAL